MNNVIHKFLIILCCTMLVSSCDALNPQSNALTRVTIDPARDIRPAWSPDGKYIAFVKVPNLSADIYLFEIENELQIRLTENDEADVDLLASSWSPDSEKLVFNWTMGGPEIVTIDVSEAIRQPQTLFDFEEIPASYTAPWFPSWGPSGYVIAFAATTEGEGPQIILFDLLTDKFEAITPLEEFAWVPSWSPDGRQIVFERVNTDENGDFEGDICIVDVNDQAISCLTEGLDDDTEPAWSPSGDRIAFVSERDGNKELYVIRPDGRELTRLTEEEADDYSPTWSPDGTQIAFVSERDGNPELYIMDVP